MGLKQYEKALKEAEDGLRKQPMVSVHKCISIVIWCELM